MRGVYRQEKGTMLRMASRRVVGQVLKVQRKPSRFSRSAKSMVGFGGGGGGGDGRWLV